MRDGWWIGIVAIALASSACRPECKPGEVRYGDGCTELPDAAAEDRQAATADASGARDSTTDTSAEPTTTDATGNGPTVDAGGASEHVTGGGDGGPDAASGAAEIDPCEPDPCASGFVCESASSEGARCVAACASDELGCQPGDACSQDADCQTGGDVTATCEPSAKLCVKTCGDTTIVSPANLEAARYCREIEGDLLLDPTFASVDSSAFPYLIRVRGQLGAGAAASSTLVSVTLSKLQRVDGSVRFASLVSLKSLELPRLGSIGAGVVVTIAPSLERIALPQLTEVSGTFGLVGLPRLTQIDVGKLKAVDGALSLRVLCALPWSQVAPLKDLGDSQAIAAIGCCNTLGTYNCGASSSCACEGSL